MSQTASDPAQEGAKPIDGTIVRLVRAIVDEVHPEEIILFGSQARGDARPAGNPPSDFT